MRAVYLILDFELLSEKFQDVGHAIKASDPQIGRIDVTVPRFLAQEDAMQVDQPFQQAPPEAAAPWEKIASTHLSIEEEID